LNPAIQRIKEAAPLPIVAGEYIKLTKRGSSWQGLCPFHSEKTPSFLVHAEYFKCFGCDAKGDVISFLSRIESISVGAAIKLLSDRTGIPLDPQQKPRTRLQRAYDAQEMQFAEWWFSQQKDRLGARVSRLAGYAAELDDDAVDLIAESAGLLFRQFCQVPRSGLLKLTERCATSEDRREWQFWQSWPRRCADAA
jgi:DNA primase